MKNFYFLFIICLFISCKKEAPKAIPVVKKAAPAIILTDERKVEIDKAKGKGNAVVALMVAYLYSLHVCPQPSHL